MRVHGRDAVLLAARALTAALVISFCAHSVAHAQDEGAEEPRPFPRRYEHPAEATATKGFLFLDGEYVPGPYEIRYAENEVTINGRKLTCLPRRTFYGGRGHGYGYLGDGSGFMPPGFGRNVDPWRPMVSELAQQLAGDSIVMSFANQPLVTFGSSGSTYDLLKHLTGQVAAEGRNAGSISQVSFIQQLPEGFDHAVWNEWIEGYEPPKNLVDRGLALVSAYDATEKEALTAIAARRRLEAWSYPLTIGLMVVTVLAVGHLLGGRPHAGKPTTGIDDSPEMIRALNCSLIFVAVLSVGDLVLTILAGQAGQMRELNPLGSHLIHDTRHLFGFKVGATLPALGLLWLLRRHKRAQIAAWWICLILVIVTFRWLTIHSTFVAA
jgi:hypothetical protein